MPDRRYADRDERGWRIPRTGTRSHLVYDGLCRGLAPIEMQAQIGGSLAALRVLIWRIKHPDAANAYSKHYRRAQEDAEDAAYQ